MNILHNLRNLLFPHRPAKQKALKLYLRAGELARNRDTYQALDLPDTQEGRFGFLSLHVYMALEALKKHPNLSNISQELVDLFFDDMDASLREMGVNDLGVGKRMKIMAKAFYGGLEAFENAKDKGIEALTPYFQNNLYIGKEKDQLLYATLASYIQNQRAVIDQLIHKDFTFF